MILPIYAYGSPVLRKKGENITPDYPQLKELLERTNHAARIGTWESNFDTKELYLSKILKDILEIPPEENPPLDIAIEMCKEGYHREKMQKSIQQLAFNTCTTFSDHPGSYMP